MIYLYSKDGATDYYFLVLKKRFNRKRFLKKAKVKKDSYAENIFARIYDALISETIDIQKEYRKYYIDEYDSITKFLYKRYNIGQPLIGHLVEKIENGYQVFYSTKHSAKDYTISSLIFSEPMLEKLNLLLS